MLETTDAEEQQFLRTLNGGIGRLMAVIDQVKGILMERFKVTEDVVFTLLAHASQQSNVKLRDIAEELVTTGSLRSSRN